MGTDARGRAQLRAMRRDRSSPITFVYHSGRIFSEKSAGKNLDQGAISSKFADIFFCCSYFSLHKNRILQQILNALS